MGTELGGGDMAYLCIFLHKAQYRKCGLSPKIMGQLSREDKMQ
jgi:hypothetical protein